MAKSYQKMMNNWARAKKLHKTVEPKPLAPAVQHHEWFYSDKQEEILKALNYYYQNKVRFMLEKAVTNKDKAISAKATELLEKLKQGGGDETK
jgi:hypothetical protein